MFLALETSTFDAMDRRVGLWKRTLLALEANLFSAKDERGERVCCLRRTNSFSAKDGMRLVLKMERVCRWRKICLMLETNYLVLIAIAKDRCVWHWRRTLFALETNPKPKVGQPSLFLVQILATLNFQLVFLGTRTQAQPNASHFSMCTRLEYFCTSPRILQ